MTLHFKAIRGFTVVELFGVLLLITLLISLLLPAVQASREQARRTSCANNLLQIGLAVQSYHSAFDQLPIQLSGTDGSTVAGQDNDMRLSIFVGLLPFIDQQTIWEMIQQPVAKDVTFGGGMFLSMEEYESEEDGEVASEQPPWIVGGPELFVEDYPPWHIEPQGYRCPSDPGMGFPSFGRMNYAVCIGDGMMASDSGPLKEIKGQFVVDEELSQQTRAAMRGMLVPRVATHFSDASDGLSQTILLGEIATDLGDRDIRTHALPGPGVSLREKPNWARLQPEMISSERPNFWSVSPVISKLDTTQGWGRGFRWADGMPYYTSFNTILPPNREVVLNVDRDDTWGIVTASSRHQGGVQICMGDGSVKFVGDSIDAGDESQSTVYEGSSNPPLSKSPFGLWGALGTRESHELRFLQK